jgi:predicted NodU family carbamoyl transferase
MPVERGANLPCKKYFFMAENASLGHFYLEVTGFLGMKPFEHEFKVMGLAPMRIAKT